MSFVLYQISYLIKEKKHKETKDRSNYDDKSRYSKDKDKSLTKVGHKGDGNDPINPHFTESLEIILDGFIELIEFFDDTDSDESYCTYNCIAHGLMIVDHRDRELDAGDEVCDVT